MPKLGSTFVRKPNKDRLRSDGPGIKVQNALLIDLESGKFDPQEPANIVASRPGLYGSQTPNGATQRRAARDKIRQLLRIKEENPAEYW